MSHSIIPPSSAGIWGKLQGCTGWVMMTQRYPELEPAPEAAEGEASHELAAHIINEATKGYNVTMGGVVGLTAPNGIIYDEEMYDAALVYAQDVINIMRKTGVFGGNNFGVESKIKCPEIHEQSYGTCDCFLFDSKNGDLYIWDYKYGYLTVEVFENWQMINYLAGIILNRLELNGYSTQHITVHIRVVQPRALHRDGPIREWTTIASDLRPYWNILSSNAKVALSNDATTRAGSHCTYCTARYACESALVSGTSLYEAAMTPTPIDLTPLQLGVQLSLVKRAVKQLESLESGYEELARSVFRSGTIVPGWLMEMGKGRDKWSKSDAEIISLGKLLGHDLSKPVTTITPTQARKLGIDGNVIKAYSVTTSTGLKIVPDNGNKAKRVFNS